MTIHVTGKVQGVTFREHAKERAKILGLKGYVKNLENGAVEIVAEGEQLHLADLVAWTKKGPPTAEVTNVEVTYDAPKNTFESFKVVY